MANYFPLIVNAITGQIDELPAGSNLDMANSGIVNLTNLTIASSDLYLTGGNAGDFLQTDGAGNLTWAPASGGNSTPGGSNTQLQYNNNGVFGGITGATYDGVTLALGNVANVSINGGATGQVLTTDGAGNLSFANVAGSSVEGPVANALYGDFSGVAFSVDAANVTGTVASAVIAESANVAGEAFFVLGSNVSGPVSSSNTANTALSVTGSNVVGAVADAIYATTAGTAQSVAGVNVSGQVSNAAYATEAGSAATVAGANVTGAVANATFATTSGTADSVAGANVVGEVANAVFATFAGEANSVAGANVVGAVANAVFATSAGTADSVAGANVTGTVANAAYAVTAGSASTADSVAGANVTGTVANATFATTAGSASTADSVAGANVTGEVANANYAAYAGNVVNSNQPNITAVGNLSSLVVTGNAEVGSILTNNYLYANGQPVDFNSNGSSNITQVNAGTGLSGGGSSGAVILNIANTGVSNGTYGSANTVATFTVNDQGQLTSAIDAPISIPGTAVTSEVANAAYATVSGTAYSVDAANVTGSIANATFATTAGTADSVAGANVTGEVANAVYATNSANATFATTAGTADSVSGANVVGEVANAAYATIAGTAYSVSGANVVGEVANAAFATQSANANYSAYTAASGANGEVQFSSNGLLGSSANLTFTDTVGGGTLLIGNNTLLTANGTLSTVGTNLYIQPAGNLVVTSSTYDLTFDLSGNLTAPGNINTPVLQLQTSGTITTSGGASSVTIDPAGAGSAFITVPTFQDGGEQLVINNHFFNSDGIYIVTETSSFQFKADYLKFPDGTQQTTAYPGSKLSTVTVSSATGTVTSQLTLVNYNGAVTITLPTAGAGDIGAVYYVTDTLGANRTGNAITIVGADVADTIIGQANATIIQPYNSLTFVCTGANAWGLL